MRTLDIEYVIQNISSLSSPEYNINTVLASLNDSSIMHALLGQVFFVNKMILVYGAGHP